MTIEVRDDIPALAGLWHAFERRAARSIYQRFEWIAAWDRHLKGPSGIRPAIVIGRRGGEPVFILPLGIQRKGGLKIASWLGGSHINFHMGLFDPGFAQAATREDVEELIAEIAHAIGPIDYFSLCCQPVSWEGVPNPLVFAPGLMRIAPVQTMSLDGGFATVLDRHNGRRKRKKLRWQENTLAPYGGFTFLRGDDEATAHMLLDAFLEQKAERLRQAGLRNVFADKGTDGFFHELIGSSIGHEQPTIALYGIEVAGKIRATFAGGVDRGRFHGYFNAISDDELTRASLGELLLFKVIEDACARGLATLDLGVGEERYKSTWLDLEEAQFSSFIPVSAVGHLAAHAEKFRESVKLSIRTNPNLWPYVKYLRRKLNRSIQAG